MVVFNHLISIFVKSRALRPDLNYIIPTVCKIRYPFKITKTIAEPQAQYLIQPLTKTNKEQTDITIGGEDDYKEFLTHVSNDLMEKVQEKQDALN
ncbi:hypothetical protein LpLQ80_16160 (plasmid) [Lactiplantibacillus plantarum]|nr:hypothetical protein LpLQ80_16160 [Lactiplantibacillus plantarum]